MSLLTTTCHWAKTKEGHHHPACVWPPDERERVAAMRLLFVAFLVRHGYFNEEIGREVMPCDCGHGDGGRCYCDETDRFRIAH